MNPYNQSINELCKQFSTDVCNGLSDVHIARLQEHYGFNELAIVRHQSWIFVFIKQFQNPLIYFLLCAATIIYFVSSDTYDAFIISGVLLFNACIGMIQEGRTRKILDALTKYSSSTTVVVRNGQRVLVPDKNLVPGDLMLLQEGQKVAADARIVSSDIIKVDESSFSGESKAVTKNNKQLTEGRSLFEQTNMVFQGTYIVVGSGKAIVVATGSHTELGKIHASLAAIDVPIPLRQELDRLSTHIVWGALGLCILLFSLGLMTGKPLADLLVMLTALFICVIPEGLPIVLTLILVNGTYTMFKNNVLVKNLQAVEGLGRVDVIVIDKTGTLTRNEMMVSSAYADGHIWHITGHGYVNEGSFTSDTSNDKPCDDSSNLWLMAAASSLFNTSEIIYNSDKAMFEIKGQPTEAALYIFSQKLGIKKTEIEKLYQKIYEIPFDSLDRYRAGFYRTHNQIVAFVAGSPELLLTRSSYKHENTEHALEGMLENGLRIVAFAQKVIFLDDDFLPPVDGDQENAFYRKLIEKNLLFLGFCGIEDALRQDIKDILAQVHQAGLQVVMATGDHKVTALYVAKKTGIYRAGDIVLQGTDFDQMSDEELVSCSKKISICARVTPDQKIRLVKAFQKNGMLVAMTGDGINDAPSLVAADIGIGMGRIGTEVAKQSSDIILLDDSFESIVKAIELGRHIFYRIKQVVLYFFATNIAEVLIVVFALLAGLPLPITASQILWLNLITDGFLDSALSVEPQEESLLGQRWRYRKKHLVDASLWIKTVYMALPMSIGSFVVFSYYYKQDILLARTMTLFTMAMFQWFNAWNCRSTTKSIFQLGFFSNIWLVYATSFVFLLQLAMIYLPFMNFFFKTVPLSAGQCMFALCIASTILILEELCKAFFRSPIMVDTKN